MTQDLSTALADTDSTKIRPHDNSARLHPLADRFFRPIRLAKLACLLGLAVFVPYLLQRLPNLAARPEYQLAASKVRLTPAPQHPVPADLVDQIFHQHQLAKSLSLLDPNLSQKLADSFAQSPWIAKVNAVKHSFLEDVEVEVEYRRAVAMVQVKGGRMPVDREGHLLPSADFSQADVSRFPLIRLAGGGTLASALNEPGLPGAARIAELLTNQWERLHLEAIELPRNREVSGNGTDLVFQLRSKDGSTIIWGRAPGTDHPGELTAQQKSARLEKYVAEFGGFNRPNGPYEIDIRHWQEITRRPAARTQSSSKRETRIR